MPTGDKITSPNRDKVASTVVRSPWVALMVSAALLLATVALYWPVLRCGFINFDDQDYVTQNVYVQNGLTWESVKWAFSHSVSANWHPLTMLSHMLDCQLYGLKPAGHHLTSVILHALNGVLVFVLLRQLTGAVWRSLLVAALFAFHPLRVESVAWIAERKDVLSGCFGLLTLIFYARYAQKRTALEAAPAQGAKRQKAMAVSPWPALWEYGLALGFFALGLMSKPMLVTWPFVLLLLDFWPLCRMRSSERGMRNFQKLVMEKIPFFVLTAVACFVTLAVQRHGGAMANVENTTFGARGVNALVSCCRYLEKLFWPSDLAFFYPYTGAWPPATVLLAGGLVLFLSVLLLSQRRRYPFLLMGWLWFCGTLTPVVGLVQVGAQAMADRYTYLPSLGIYLLVVWGAWELFQRWRYAVVACSMAAFVLVSLCFVLTRQQLGYWQDSATLWHHTIECTEDNYIAHNLLGLTLLDRGQYDGAGEQFQEALRLKPNFAYANNNLGDVYYKQGRTDEAIGQYEAALGLKPDYAEARFNLGIASFKLGRLDQAVSQYQQALRLKPDYAEAHFNLGIALGRQGQIGEAIRHFQAAVRLNPYDATYHNNLGNDLARQGQLNEAISEFREALRLKPDYAIAKKNLSLAMGMKSTP